MKKGQPCTTSGFTAFGSPASFSSSDFKVAVCTFLQFTLEWFQQTNKGAACGEMQFGGVCGLFLEYSLSDNECSSGSGCSVLAVLCISVLFTACLKYQNDLGAAKGVGATH